MSSLDPIPTTLSEQLRQLGLVHTATDLNDLVARATQKRWVPSSCLNSSPRHSSMRACGTGLSVGSATRASDASSP